MYKGSEGADSKDLSDEIITVGNLARAEDGNENRKSFNNLLENI